ncbi:transposase, partial [Caldalkalibacillus uzonensis]|uniref:transposase n=1 Tax=Caldalkalibacillus uzonensis TaxID=353224 RepID=UPI0027D9042D
LHERLKSDLKFRYRCGFALAESPPSVSTFSRVFRHIVDKGIAEQLFRDLVQLCKAHGVIKGEKVAIDSMAIDAYEKKRSKKQCQDSELASWGAKFDEMKQKITWFGYKIHLAVDTESELPTALEVTTASVNDGDVFPDLVKEHVDLFDGLKYVIADAGYDQLKCYQAARDYGAQAIIPLNLRNEKEPPEGMTSNGTPICSMGYEMTYWGSEGRYLKFRCPHATGKVDCPHGTIWCSPSNYGMVVKKKADDDLRRYAIPHRESQTWQDLYRKRSCVERCNSRMKSHMTANRLHVQGRDKVKVIALFNAITLLVQALSMHLRQSMNIAA